MPTVAELYNQAGRRVADQTTPILVLRAQGTEVTREPVISTNTGNKGLRVVLPASYQHPLIAFRHFRIIGPCGTAHPGDGTVHHWFMTDGQNVGVEVPWYAFEVATAAMAPAPSGSVGLELFNQAGQVTFSTHGNIAQVVAVNQTIQLPPGKQYATAMGLFAGQRWQELIGDPDVPGSQTRVQNATMWGGFSGRDIYSNGGSWVGFGEFQYQIDFPSGLAADLTAPFGAGLVIDVTPFA